MNSKAKVSRIEAVQVPRFRASDHPENAHTPTCEYCNQSIGILEDSMCIIPGQWMPNRDLGNPVFVLEPDVQLQVVQLANGQLALTVDDGVARHVHTECHEQMKAEVLGIPPWGFEEEEYGR